ncbi:MAG: hypothetical protein RIE31_06825 [Alphaproteobacteria bacterium]
MAAEPPWSIKGISDEARLALRSEARRRGRTTGDLLSEIIRREAADAGPADNRAAQAGSDR